MASVTFNVPDNLCVAWGMPREALAREFLLAAAMKLYEMKRLSSGAAAVLAGIPKPVFVSRLADFGIPAIRLTNEELQEDVDRA